MPPLPELTPALGLSALGGYLLGAIPFGLVLVKLAGLGDIRDVGSGNIGATNVLRTGNKFLAFLTLVLDSGKGAAAALLTAYFVSVEAGMIAGLFGVLGHNFPVWLKFKGGKGVATTLGVHLAVLPLVGVMACATWLLVAGIFRYSSLASLGALVAAPVYAWWLNEPLYMWIAGMLGVLAVVRHHANIKRLIRGEESKIGQKNS